MATKSDFNAFLAKRAEEAAKVIDTFREELAENPSTAMAWSSSIFRAAADIDVCHRLEMFGEGAGSVDLELVRQWLIELICQNGSSLNTSSLITSNLMKQAVVEAAISLQDRLKYL